MKSRHARVKQYREGREVLGKPFPESDKAEIEGEFDRANQRAILKLKSSSPHCPKDGTELDFISGSGDEGFYCARCATAYDASDLLHEELSDFATRGYSDDHD